MAKKVHIYIRDEVQYKALKKALGDQSFSAWVEKRIEIWAMSQRAAGDWRVPPTSSTSAGTGKMIPTPQGKVMRD